MKQGCREKIMAMVGILLFVILFSAGFSQAQSTSERKSTRLPFGYEGAPPLIPHEVEARKGVCLSCHGTGEGGAPITPHPGRTFCIQCHIGQDMSVKPFVERSSKNP